MPNFTSVFSADSWRRKFEEARISDLNYELGKWAQESKNKLSHRLRLGNSPSSGSSWHSNRSAVPKSTSVSGVNLLKKVKSLSLIPYLHLPINIRAHRGEGDDPPRSPHSLPPERGSKLGKIGKSSHKNAI